MKRLTQLELSDLFTIAQDEPIDENSARRLVKKGLAVIRGNEVFISDEGKRALERAMEGTLTKASKQPYARNIDFAGNRLQIDDSGKLSVFRERINTQKSGDYGADPLNDGTFRMVPSGDIVDFAERQRRLGKK